VFFGDVFRLSVLLAPNAVTGFAGGVLEQIGVLDRLRYCPEVQTAFNFAQST